MVDNCYGEFEKGTYRSSVDLLAGSLIKTLWWGIVLTGGYIVGKQRLIKEISYRLTSLLGR